jgi:hypothetical protein
MLKFFIKPWVQKRPKAVIGWLVRPLVQSLHRSGINFDIINRWLRHIGHAPVKGYMILGNRELLLFFKDIPDQERRKKLGGNYVVVEAI